MLSAGAAALHSNLPRTACSQLSARHTLAWGYAPATWVGASHVTQREARIQPPHVWAGVYLY